MNLDKYQQAWKADSAQMQVTIDTDSLSKEVQHSHQAFQSMIFWRDVREAGGSLALIPIWLVMGFGDVIAVDLVPWRTRLHFGRRRSFCWIVGVIRNGRVNQGSRFFSM